MAGLNDLAAEGKLTVPKLSSAVGSSTNKELMADARDSLSGNWLLAIIGFVLYGILIFSFMLFTMSSIIFASVTSASSSEEFLVRLGTLDPLLQLVQLLVSGAITVGFAGYFLGIAQNGQVELELLFVGFRRFWKSFGVYFFYSLFIGLWTLLLVIPGIIAAFRYAMAFYVIADDEDCGPLEAIRRSKEMMKGHKWKFFCLNFRFIGWAILCTILPIGYLWLIPYMQTSFAKFYEDVS